MQSEVKIDSEAREGAARTAAARWTPPTAPTDPPVPSRGYNRRSFPRHVEEPCARGGRASGRVQRMRARTQSARWGGFVAWTLGRCERGGGVRDERVSEVRRRRKGERRRREEGTNEVGEGEDAKDCSCEVDEFVFARVGGLPGPPRALASRVGSVSTVSTPVTAAVRGCGHPTPTPSPPGTHRVRGFAPRSPVGRGLPCARARSSGTPAVSHLWPTAPSVDFRVRPAIPFARARRLLCEAPSPLAPKTSWPPNSRTASFSVRE